MKSIYSCMLFKGSKNQAAIRAAIDDPVNRELVVQLNKYLDEDDLQEIAEQHIADAVEQAPDAEAVPVQDPEVAPSLEEDSSDGVPADKRVVRVDHIEHKADSEEPADDDVVETPQEEPVAESNIGKAADTDVIVASDDPGVPALDTVQGNLNAVEETSGVVRTRAIGDELWIYYNDKKNLNNLMGAVIDSLSASGYYQLEFNRLARTENAIVFQITNTSTEVSNGET